MLKLASLIISLGHKEKSIKPETNFNLKLSGDFSELGHAWLFFSMAGADITSFLLTNGDRHRLTNKPDRGEVETENGWMDSFTSYLISAFVWVGGCRDI